MDKQASTFLLRYVSLLFMPVYIYMYIVLYLYFVDAYFL